MFEAMLMGMDKKGGSLPGNLEKITPLNSGPNFVNNSYCGIGVNASGQKELFLASSSGGSGTLNLETLMWTAVTNTYAGEATSVVVDNKLYVIAGGGGKLNRAYDFATRTWATRAAYPGTATYGMGSSVHDGKIYTAGGYFINGSSTVFDRSFRQYDPVTNVWTDLTSQTTIGALPARYVPLFQMLDADNFIFGLGSASPALLTDVIRLDRSGARITLASRNPGPGRATPSFLINGKVVFYASSPSGAGINIYDVDGNQWLDSVATEASFNANRGLLTWDRDKSLYLIGQQPSGLSGPPDIWKYTLQD